MASSKAPLALPALLVAALLLLLLAACGKEPISGADGSVAQPDAQVEPAADASPTAADGSAAPDAGSLQPTDGGAEPASDASADTTRVRVMAANLSSGAQQNYDSGEGLRLIQGAQPDVVLIQEFSYGDDSDAAFRGMVDSTLGTDFQWCRESPPANPFGTTFIPNGILSRWPIVECGSWDDPQTDSRGFAYARIDLPGPRDLWAVSLHLLTKDVNTRDAESISLVASVRARVPATDLLVVGGDFNTDDNVERCYVTLSGLVDVAAPHPADQDGNIHTNITRVKDYDHVFAGPSLRAMQVATEIGWSVYPAGLVLDSRVYTPLDEISPVLETDSAALNMQHMGVVKDFRVPY
ncbi:MAG TPA: endonuclease/exonuclease/phosphatase family protein [Myxococcales bacterium]|jgi:endonuclease/exonuclease/phosphatase family metal-dependent hydrolase